MELRLLIATTMLPACVLAVPGAVPSARSAELQQPIPLYTAGLSTSPPADPSCPPLSLPGPVEPGRLIIRDADRPDVGPYTVRLPGYGTNPMSSAGDSYRPFLVTASPGDTLRFDLVNQLASSEALGGTVNLHTHGLIVSPRPCTPIGDYIFVADLPGTVTHDRMDIPRTVPGYMFGSRATPQPYPSGLNWFHAHLHGKAEQDVVSGQAGMLYIGDLRADLRATPGLDAASADTLDRSDVRYLGLRDIQLAVPAGATPEKANPGQRAQWISGGDYDSGACPAQANPPQPGPPASFAGPGYCGHRGTTVGVTDRRQDTIWLFTINGQANPAITVPPGRHQIWRIANLSADVVYVLELVDDATGQPQPLDVLSLDGLVAGTSTGGANALHVGVTLKHLLLMPASRAEVFVANLAGPRARAMTLRTAGITTGPAGDSWPAISLARVVMQPSSGTAAAQARLDMTLPVAAPTAAVPVQPSAASAAAIPSNCVTLLASTPARRRITFLENGSAPSGTPEPFDFGFKSEVVTAAGTSLGSKYTIGPEPFPMQAMLAPNAVPHICPRLGTQEVWELVNTTGELHNFHVHQSKFRLAAQSDEGAPANMDVIQDPTGFVAQYEPEVQGAVPAANVDVWHDVLPVPPALLNADGSVNRPGRVFVTIPFYAPQQVGDFVFHCHILEHEDGGMMGVVQVYDPTQLAANDVPDQIARLARSSMCGLPSAEPGVESVSSRMLGAARAALRSALGALSAPTASWAGEASVR